MLFSPAFRRTSAPLLMHIDSNQKNTAGGRGNSRIRCCRGRFDPAVCSPLTKIHLAVAVTVGFVAAAVSLIRRFAAHQRKYTWRSQ
jgi:hypothetical protein